MAEASSENNSGRPTFKFWPWRETVDWRSVNLVDVDQVASQVDLRALQKHLSTVIFCSLEDECCPRCRAPVDPGLVKLLRLAQLTLQWVLHCQDLLVLSLRAAEERLPVAGRERDELLERRLTQLKKSMEAIQEQPKLLAVIGHKDNMQRRHPGEFDAELQSKGETSQLESLKAEISGLKEQVARQQQALEAKAAQEKEQQFLYQDLLQEVERYKAEKMLQDELSRELQLKEQTVNSMRQQRDQGDEWDQVKSVSENTSGVEVPVVVTSPPPEPQQTLSELTCSGAAVYEEPDADLMCSNSARVLYTIQELLEEDEVLSPRPVQKTSKSEVQHPKSPKSPGTWTRIKRRIANFLKRK